LRVGRRRAQPRDARAKAASPRSKISALNARDRCARRAGER
jgi:hypothetical protein